MPHGGGEGQWSMDNSPTPPQVGRVGLIIDRCISKYHLELLAENMQHAGQGGFKPQNKSGLEVLLFNCP